MKSVQFEICIGSDNQFYFRLRAANGENILASEEYVTKGGCLKGINSVKDNAIDKSNFRARTATDGQFYFVLVAQNGEIIGTSEMYTTEHARDNGIEAVSRVAPDAIVKELLAEDS